MRAAAAVLCASAGACAQPQYGLPESSGAKSTIVLFDGAQPAAYANDLGEGAKPLLIEAPRDTGSVTVLFYDQTLRDLAIPSGRLIAVSVDQPGRTLPAPARAWEADTPDGAELEWRAIEQINSALFNTLRIAADSPAACAARGGCLQDDALCKAPCPTPEPPLQPSFPDLPTLPDMRPCPAGWSERTIAGAPGAIGCGSLIAPLSCAAGSAPFPSDNGCAPIGPPCPAGDWPEDLPIDRPRIFLRSGAQNGDGSEALPYGDLATAIASAPDGAIVAIAPGVYGAATIDRGLELRGACVERVSLTGVQVTNGRLARAQVNGVIEVGSGALDAIIARGVRVTGDASLYEALIQGGGGTAIEALTGARVTARRIAAIGPDFAVQIETAATATISDAFFSGTSDGDGIVNDGRLELSAAVIEGFFGIRVWSRAGSILRAEHVALRGDPARPSTGGVVAEGAAVSARSIWIEDVDLGVKVAGAISATISDLVVSYAPEAARGFALSCYTATCDVSRVLITGAPYGVDVQFPPVLLNVRDLSVLGSINRGLVAHGGAQIQGRRIAVRGAGDWGLYSSGAGSFSLSDMRIEETRGGVWIQAATEVELTQLALKNVQGIGLQVGEGVHVPEAHVSSLTIDGVSSAPCVGFRCLGIGAGVVNGHLSIEGFHIAGGERAAVWIDGQGALDLEDGVLARSPIGAGIGASGFDVSRLLQGVKLEEIGVFCDPCGN